MTLNEIELELCKCRDEYFSCQEPCQSAIDFEAPPEDCYTKEYKEKGMGLPLDGTRTISKNGKGLV